jgi:hypothetical protein
MDGLRRHGWRAWRTLGSLTLLALVPLGSSWAQAVGSGTCGPLKNAYGPIDFRRSTAESRAIVEEFHFPPDVETLKGGKSGYLAGDLGYTLRAFPNHPRALMSIMRLGEREKTAKPSNSQYTVECWFDRALRFAPDDPMPRLIYAIYLDTHKRFPEMREQLEAAEKLQGDTPANFDIDYNAALLYFDVKDYDKASQLATRAYSMGASLPGLRNKLKSVGKWREPDPQPQAPPAEKPAE